jgi:hypothetical protein
MLRRLFAGTQDLLSRSSSFSWVDGSHTHNISETGSPHWLEIDCHHFACSQDTLLVSVLSGMQEELDSKVTEIAVEKSAGILVPPNAC